MKTMLGSQLNKMHVGTIFAHLRHKTDECCDSSPGPLMQILTTYTDDNGETFIGRTDDGVLCTDEAYNHDYQREDFEPNIWNAPLAYCWGTSSVGCYDDDDLYVVLEDEDIERLIVKLRARKAFEDPRYPGFKELALMKESTEGSLSK
jgi:hypothetical protein